MEQKLVKESLNEDMGGAMGGVSAPYATLTNTPGMGTATPPSAATGGVGSGDNWGNSIKKKPYTQANKPKITTKKKKVTLKKKPKLEEENTNPINDETEIGKLLKGSKTTPFKKGKERGNQNSVVQKKFEHEILSLEEFKKLNETTIS